MQQRRARRRQLSQASSGPNKHTLTSRALILTNQPPRRETWEANSFHYVCNTGSLGHRRQLSQAVVSTSAPARYPTAWRWPHVPTENDPDEARVGRKWIRILQSAAAQRGPPSAPSSKSLAKRKRKGKGKSPAKTPAKRKRRKLVASLMQVMMQGAVPRSLGVPMDASSRGMSNVILVTATGRLGRYLVGCEFPWQQSTLGR